MRHYHIPIFVPHLGCPNDCAFCNQKKITGHLTIPTREDVKNIIEASLKTFKEQSRYVEVAFFGGSFTAIETRLQEELLSAAYPYVKSGEINGVRCSTRPDAISEEILARCLSYGMTTIELGVQSMDDTVLAASRRGHTKKDVEKAACLIQKAGIQLGLQMMTGLPCDSFEKDRQTAKELIELAPICVRIYPTLVLAGTELEAMYRRGNYQAQSLEDAILICAELYDMFTKSSIPVIRMGLMSSNDIHEESRSIIAGPYHSSFGELVKSRMILQKMKEDAVFEEDRVFISVHPKELSMAIGNCKCNKNFLEQKWKKPVCFQVDSSKAFYLP